MNWCGIVAVVIGINSACILFGHTFAFALVYCTGPLVVVYMAEENQIHLVVEQKRLNGGNKVVIHVGQYTAMG
uniref:Uncharacterized protein n=1 Tax=Arundo donax TaxID=35708 RepID=A0A0A9D4G7_ARUDO